MGSGVARRDPARVTPKVNWRMHTMFKVCCSKGLHDQSTIFDFFFGPAMNTKMGVVIYMYLNIPHIIFIPNIHIYMVHGLNPYGQVFWLI